MPGLPYQRPCTSSTRPGSLISIFPGVALVRHRPDLDMQIGQRGFVDYRRRGGQRAAGGGGLGERDDFANRVLVRHQRGDPVYAERDAAVRRAAVLQRLEQETEALLRLEFLDAQHVERGLLQLRIVNTNRA